MTNEWFRDLQLVIGASLVGIIWVIQILHYPSFIYYDKNRFSDAMKFHQRRISYIVLPLMITELLLSIYSLKIEMSSNNLFSLGCVILIWASTFFIQVPLHSRLTSYNEALIKSLVKGNIIRTVLWTLKLLIT